MAYSITCRHQKRVARHRKFQTLRPLSAKRWVKRNCIITKTFLHIYSLKLKLDSIRRECANLVAIKAEYLNLINHFTLPKEVKVERLGIGFLVRLSCKQRQGSLVSTLEAFDKLGLNVLQAKVSCNYLFSMEAIVAPQEDHDLDASDVTRALQRPLKKTRKKRNIKKLRAS